MNIPTKGHTYIPEPILIMASSTGIPGAHISVERFNGTADIHIQENDLLITKDGTIGKVAVAKNCPDMVSLNSGVMLIRNVRRYKYYDKYLYYILMSEQFHLWYELSQNGASTIKHLYQEQFYNFTFSFPSIPEQTAIASYLDDKCSAIDDVIAQAKETIEEYKSWKASVIFEAVTKGLDPNVEMKDSGLQDIGKYPAYWRQLRIKHRYTIVCGATPTDNPENRGGEIDWIGPADMQDFGIIKAGKRYISQSGYHSCGTTLFPAETVILSTRAPIGKIQNH